MMLSVDIWSCWDECATIRD